ncbi:SET domain-containing protein [Trametes cingulata]|nr:SET domain-containing protein [Trametes cingulata]
MNRRDFVPSPSPVEEYEGDPDQEWVVTGVVGQSIDVLGVERYEVPVHCCFWLTRDEPLQVKWGEGWKRPDGTNTTWEKPGGSETVEKLIRRWNKRQEQKRTQNALKSPEISIAIEDHQMLHEDRTFYELVRGYKELLREYPEDPHQPLDFEDTLIRIGSPEVDAPEEVLRSSSPPILSSSPVRPRPIRPLPKRAVVVRALSSSPEPANDQPISGRRPPSPRRLRRRKALEEAWAAKLDGAATITFVNRVNSEEIPKLVDDFQYVERSYVRAEDVPANSDVADCLVSCDCDGVCYDAEDCECQDPSEVTDLYGRKIFAYDEDRMFNFQLPPGTEAIECNEACTCTKDCYNRVAQLPRDVPIEIFRTESRGWGARATCDLFKGKVVGIYTGKLIRREEADRRIDERRSYIFDLDVRESADDDDEEENPDRFSVDGYAHGNWTRFVNHSCEPNMRVFPVIWDTIPELNQPYLAFVAMEDIPERTELTIDYDPKAGEEARTSKQKGRQVIPEGARVCMCGTDSCRGWVRV